MEIDTKVNDILREVKEFLERLHNAQLPQILESLRKELLVRVTEITTRTSSPEPYLNMNSGPKSLLLINSEVDSEEYVEKEGSSKQTHQDYYETFENEEQTMAMTAIEHSEQNDGQDEDQKFVGIYKNLSAAQVKSKCQKCGPLHRKEGKKLFLSDSRACWVALIGSYLLIYRSERRDRPYATHSIRGYMARPAPNLIPRDRQKSESAFEIYSPGNETLQFIARTPKEMDQWIAKVCEVGYNNKSAKNKAGRTEEAQNGSKKQSTIESLANCSKNNETTRHRDAKKTSVVDKSTPKLEMTNNRNEAERTIENPPPLPTRIPRRLPSLPDAVISYKPSVEDDDDDDEIYHKIEDLKNGITYQNIMLSKQQEAMIGDKNYEADTYDDVRLSKEKNKEQAEEKSCNAISFEETYDDISTISRINAAASVEQNQNGDRPVANVEEEQEEFYDDVQNLISSERFAKDRAKDQTEVSRDQISSKKKSFLDRVFSIRESPGKSDKRYKGKVSPSPPPSLITEEGPTYDDAFEHITNQELLIDEGEELPEYNCPPPPRPICAKPSLVNSSEIVEFYDDVSACKEEYNKKSHEQTSLQLTEESCVKAEKVMDNMMCDIELGANGNHFEKEIEHYQSPRSDLCIHDVVNIQQNEELYDDIALWVDFTARQKDITGKKDSEDAKSMNGSDKKSRNRFSVHKKSRASNDSNCSAQTNKRSSNECEEIEDSSENNSSAKRNTFQKLISRMENSLAKVSVRSPSSLPVSKLSTTCNNS